MSERDATIIIDGKTITSDEFLRELESEKSVKYTKKMQHAAARTERIVCGRRADKRTCPIHAVRIRRVKSSAGLVVKHELNSTALCGEHVESVEAYWPFNEMLLIASHDHKFCPDCVERMKPVAKAICN